MDTFDHLWNTDTVWLNTAQYGIPPAPAHQALTDALHTWQAGTGDPLDWGRAVQETRTHLAALVHAPEDDIALGSSASQITGTLAASLPDGAHVLVPRDEFTSIVYPWLSQADRGVTVRAVPLPHLAENVRPDTHLVAYSLVHSATGQIAPTADITAAARTHGARLVVDATQATGWLPVRATDYDALLGATYKWLMTPRGLAFAYLSPALRSELRPHNAGPLAARDPAASLYATGAEPHLDLADTARAFDTSPNWFACVAAAASTRVLLRAGVERVHDHNVALADHLRAALGQAPGGSAITSVERPDAAERLARAGIVTTRRGAGTRLAFHLYNTLDDAERAARALL